MVPFEVDGTTLGEANIGATRSGMLTAPLHGRRGTGMLFPVPPLVSSLG